MGMKTSRDAMLTELPVQVTINLVVLECMVACIYLDSHVSGVRVNGVFTVLMTIVNRATTISSTNCSSNDMPCCKTVHICLSCIKLSQKLNRIAALDKRN